MNEQHQTSSFEMQENTTRSELEIGHPEISVVKLSLNGVKNWLRKYKRYKKMKLAPSVQFNKASDVDRLTTRDLKLREAYAKRSIKRRY